MKKYILFLLTLGTSVGAWAGNVITVSAAEGAPGEEVTVSIGLENSDAVSSLQVSIPLDENLTLVSGSSQLSDRCGSHALTVGVKDGVLNVFIYSLSMTAITGNSGEVASLRLALGNEPTTIALTPSKTLLSAADGSPVSNTATPGAVTIRCAKAQYSATEVDFGAVPIRSTYTRTVTVKNVGNADLTVTALTFSDVNVFSSTTALPLTLAAGASQSVNITYAPTERGSISRTLKVECNSVSRLNTIALKAQPFAVNELHVQPASGVSDEEVTVTMTMNNMDDVSGYQVEFTMPASLEYVDGSFAACPEEGESRWQDHQSVASLNGTTLRIIVYSPSDTPFTGNDGVIGAFRLKLVGRNSVTLTPTKTVLSATINNQVENVVSAVTGGRITISYPCINTANSLAFGAVSVTEPCEKTFTIRNSGSAPLTVSRIVFNNEALSVKEELPLVIAKNSSTAVTVCYGSIEETAFSATMNIYSNDPGQRLKTVSVTGSRFAPNYLSVGTAPDITTSDQMELALSMDTYDDVTGLQFDVEYPGQYYTTFNGNYAIEQRAAGMTVTMRQVDSNTLRVFCYFLAGSGIAAGSGPVMTLRLKPVNRNIPEDDYTVRVTNIKMGTQTLADKYAGSSSLQATFHVSPSTGTLWGDVNGDEAVTAQDASLVLQHVAGKIALDGEATVPGGSPQGHHEADVNGDGSITAQDASLILQYVAGKITW